MTYQGSCHCGQTRYEVDGEPDSVLSCNCSMCGRRGSLLWFVPRDSLRVLTDMSGLSTYKFNHMVLNHYFCPTCGIHPFSEGPNPSGGKMAAINVRCLEGLDFESLPVNHFNGRDL